MFFQKHRTSILRTPRLHDWCFLKFPPFSPQLLWIQEKAIKPPFTIIVRDVDGPFNTRNKGKRISPFGWLGGGFLQGEVPLHLVKRSLHVKPWRKVCLKEWSVSYKTNDHAPSQRHPKLLQYTLHGDTHKDERNKRCRFKLNNKNKLGPCIGLQNWVHIFSQPQHRKTSPSLLDAAKVSFSQPSFPEQKYTSIDPK